MKTTTVWRIIVIGTVAFWAAVITVIVNAF